MSISDMNEPTNDDVEIPDDIDDPNVRMESEEEQAARKAAREAELQKAVAAHHRAVLAAERAHEQLRHVQWIVTGAQVDAAVWASIEAALESLPADATHQQIELAKAKAIAAIKIGQARRAAESLEGLEQDALKTALEEIRAKNAVKKLEREPISSWAAMGFGSLMSASLMGYIGKRIK